MGSIKLIKFTKFFLRLGLAFVFIYAAVEIHFSPENFLKYVQEWMSNLVPVERFLPIFGIAEIILALILLFGKLGRWPAFLSFFILCAITIPNLQYFNVLFRNVAIAGSALALFCLEVLTSEFPVLTKSGHIHKQVDPKTVYPPTTIGKI